MAAIGLAGCGGGSAPPKIVAGTGYAFSAPASWTVARKLHSVQVSRGISVVSVTRFPLLRRYRPSLWSQVVPEIDRTAAGIASDQHGTVTARTSVTISGLQGRRYDIAYTRDGKQLTERLGFVLRAKTEYELLCRFAHGKDASACDQLFDSFRLRSSR